MVLQEGSSSLFPESLREHTECSQEAPASPTTARAAARAPLWLGCHLAGFALEAVAPPSADSQPLAVIEGEGARRFVAACNARATAQGLVPGLSLNAAFALSPVLRTLARSERRERAALARLAAWAVQFTPIVSLEPPDALLLEVRGSLRLFGGLERLCDRVRAGLATLSYSAVLGIAPTPLAALWLARSGDERPVTMQHALAGRLGELPLTCLRWPPKLRDALRGMGVNTLRECLRLPRDGFARRFGPGRLDELDRALGRQSDPRPAFELPARFRAELELPAPVQAIEPLALPLDRLLGELCGYLHARSAGVQCPLLRLLHHGGRSTPLALDLLEPSRERAHLHGLLMVRLEGCELPAPVLGLELCSGKVEPLAPATGCLFAGAGQRGDAWPRLVERLRTRLGAEAVHGVCLVPEHRPEAAWRVAEPGGSTGAMTAKPRPLWMLAEPQRLAERAGLPCLTGPLALVSGPERIEAGWWDGAEVRRDYYVVRDDIGAFLWVYRERGGARRWFVHGIFG